MSSTRSERVSANVSTPEGRARPPNGWDGHPRISPGRGIAPPFVIGDTNDDPDDSAAQHRIRGPLRQRRDRDAAWRARPQLQARGREGPVGRKRVRQRRRRPLGMLVPRLERDQHPAADLEQAERARRPAQARDRRRRPRRRPPALRGHGPRARAPDPLLTRGGHRRARHAATPHRGRRSSACGR